MRMPTRSKVVVSLLLAGLVGACDRQSNPLQPSPDILRPNAPPAPAPPSQPAMASLTVSGPAVVPPGESATYTATAAWSDGTTTDVTTLAEWSITSDAVLTLTGPGQVTARITGEGEVRAALQGRSHGRAIVVVPAGRFAVRVDVSDGLIPDAPVFDARVEVISGPAAGLAATTNWYGTASLYGVPETADLRVTKDGYEPVVRSVRIDHQRARVGVQIVPSVRRPALSGAYRLTVSADLCAGDGVLPENAKTRTYTAAIWEPGGKVKVQLSDATFDLKSCCFGEQGDGFSGLTQAVDTRFTLIPYEPDWDWNAAIHPSVAERLPDGSVLTISGRAVVRPAPDGFAGILDGVIAIYDALPLSGPGGRLLASCQSPTHTFTLRR
jgi:hypothetical protein